MFKQDKTGQDKGNVRMKQLLAETQRRIRFELSAEPGSKVFVAGTFNKWSTTANPLKDGPNPGHFKTAVYIPTGTHEYRFVVDNVWSMDSKCLDWTPNGYGSLNSVLHV